MFVRRIVASIAGLLLAACSGPGPLRFDPPQPAYDFGFRGGDGRAVHVATPFAQPIQPCPAAQEPPGKGKPVLLGPSWQDFLACAAEPAPWLADQLSQSLRAAAFRLVDEASLGQDGLRVEGAIHTLVVEANSGRLTPAALDLYVELHVTTASGLSARRRFYVQSIQGAWDARDRAQAALDDAFRRAVRDMTAATLSLSNRFPPSPALAETDTP